MTRLAAQPGPRGVRDALRELGRRPRKRLGQHFLADPHTAHRIVDLARLTGTDRVVEIGPGLGALTDALATRAAELWLVEVDRDFAARLRARYADRPHVYVVEADVLTIEFSSLLGPGEPAVVVANLPYNIGTAVLLRLLASHGLFRRLVLMLQREVADRLQAAPGTKAYGALSVHAQFAARIERALRVPPGAFVPPPKVDSAVVLLEPYRTAPVAVGDAQLMERVVRTAFNQRRKQLINSLRAICAHPAVALARAGIAPHRRPETLTLDEFARLADAIAADARTA